MKKTIGFREYYNYHVQSVILETLALEKSVDRMTFILKVGERLNRELLRNTYFDEIDKNLLLLILFEYVQVVDVKHIQITKEGIQALKSYSIQNTGISSFFMYQNLKQYRLNSFILIFTAIISLITLSLLLIEKNIL